MIVNEKAQGLINPEDQRQGPNCGITAIAVATGISFDKSWNLHKQVNFRKRDGRWKGSTHDGERKLVLHKLKIKFVNHICYNKFNFKYKKSSVVPFSHYPITLRKYIELNCNKTSTYIITTTGHVQVVKGKSVVDQGGVKTIEGFWGRNKKVVSVIEILKKFGEKNDN